MHLRLLIFKVILTYSNAVMEPVGCSRRLLDTRCRWWMAPQKMLTTTEQLSVAILPTIFSLPPVRAKYSSNVNAQYDHKWIIRWEKSQNNSKGKYNLLSKVARDGHSCFLDELILVRDQSVINKMVNLIYREHASSQAWYQATPDRFLGGQHHLVKDSNLALLNSIVVISVVI